MLKTNPHLLRKIIATLIDSFINFFVYFFFILSFGHPNESGGRSMEGPIVLIPIVISFVYVILFETFFSATIGHLVVSLKVVSFDGSKVRFNKALIRRLADILDLYLTVGFLALILVLTSRYNQRLGDQWAKTRVVSAKDPQEGMANFDFEINN